MTSPRTRLALLFAAAALGGCAVVPAYDYGPSYGYGQGYEPAPAVTVYAAPPAPLVEYRGLPPAYGYVWLDGYWNWGGARYSWVPGRWQNPPPGQVWVPRVWQRDGDRWQSHGGHWQEQREYRRSEPSQPGWPHRESQPQPIQRSPEPWRRQEWRPESQPEPHQYQHPSRDSGPPPALLRQTMPQSPVQGGFQPAPEPQRRAEGPLQRVLSEAQRMSPAVARPEPPARPAEAAPQRRGGDEGRRIGRRWPDDGESRDRH